MQIAIKSIANVPESEVLQMLALHRQYYSNVKQEKFFSDFREKTWCIVVADDGGQVQGYSTLQRIPMVWNQKPYDVLFSGNTLMNQACWNLNYIGIGFSHMCIHLLREFTDPDHRCRAQRAGRHGRHRFPAVGPEEGPGGGVSLACPGVQRLPIRDDSLPLGADAGPDL